MIARIEALNYRCLRSVHAPVQPFQVLVGPNASGKSTFLDILAFLHQMLRDDVEAAITTRSDNLADLVWQRTGTAFELAIEVPLPEGTRPHSPERIVRYTVAVGLDVARNERAILRERVLVTAQAPRPADDPGPRPFPADLPTPPSLFGPAGAPLVVDRVGATATFHAEAPPPAPRPKGNGRNAPAPVTLSDLSPQRSALSQLFDFAAFPALRALRATLLDGIHALTLDDAALRQPSPPGLGRQLRPDGANLPFVVAELRDKAPDRFAAWIGHLQTALPDLQGIRVITRDEDRSRYLILDYPDGLAVPSWLASDGTLRLLALTVLAYLPDLAGTYLIEEPETGIHPRAIETVMHSLMGVYDAQILVATQSPVVLSVVPAAQVLVFAKTPAGATDIVRGDQHPALRDWQGEPNLGMLFAGGVLG